MIPSKNFPRRDFPVGMSSARGNYTIGIQFWEKGWELIFLLSMLN